MRVPHRIGHHEVDSSIEQALEVFLEAEVGVERIRCTVRELDEDIHVTVPGSESVAGCRAKQAEALHAVRATRTGDRFTVQKQGRTHGNILPIGNPGYAPPASAGFDASRSAIGARRWAGSATLLVRRPAADG